MVMANGFNELNVNEMMEVDGGEWYDGVITGLTGFGVTCAACAYIGGSSVLTMGVPALVACGPAGWLVLGVGVVGAAASGAAAANAAKK